MYYICRCDVYRVFVFLNLYINRGNLTQRKEDDVVEILSGVFEGKTTGAPIGFIIRNKDQRSQDYSKIKDTFRPGHADFSYQQKYESVITVAAEDQVLVKPLLELQREQLQRNG